MQMRSSCSTLESSIEEESKGLIPESPRWRTYAILSNLQKKNCNCISYSKTREGNTSAPSTSSTNSDTTLGQNLRKLDPKESGLP
ncbi:hypothetical protein CR513_15666, partial [Mucuna pruriens]